MYPSLDRLRSVLGLYEVTAIGAVSDGQGPGTTVEAKWPCGCTARGSNMTAMEHFNCKRHEPVRAALPFPGDRRKTKPG